MNSLPSLLLLSLAPQPLVNTGLFTNNDIDITKMTSTPIALTTLSGYECVVVWTNFKPPSPVEQGDRLKEYVDGGGWVTLMVGALPREGFSFEIQGGIRNDG
jgi:hypothetical protein